MLILITYDVNTTFPEGRRRLSKIAKCCCNYGQRVQNSVFECSLDNAQYVLVKNQLIGIMDKNKDSLRFYNLGNKYLSKLEQYGVKKSYDPEGELIL
ncbi:MAG: CRISPR-associated endonuclease Cas2 [Sphaerochaeta sp.]